MNKNRKLTTNEFNYLKSLVPYISRKTLKHFKAFKHMLMDEVQATFGDKWYNLSSNTREAIENICFLSVDRGFFYKTPKTIASDFSIGLSTVYKALKELRDVGLLFKANQSSGKQNGLGSAVHFFSVHPYFNDIVAFLGVDWKAEEKAQEKPEIAEIPYVASDSGDFDGSTYSLPVSDLKDLDLHTNVPDTSDHKIIKYVPREINSLYAGIFDFRLRSVWQKITQAWKSIKHASLNRAYLLEVGSQIIKRIYQIWKDHMHNKREMTVDEMCAYAYKATRDTIYTNLATQHMFDYDAEENAIMAEAVSEIPALEDICVSVNPHYDYHAIKEHVIGCIDWAYRMLSKNALARIVEHYDRYSVIRSSRSAIAATGLT